MRGRSRVALGFRVRAQLRLGALDSSYLLRWMGIRPWRICAWLLPSARLQVPIPVTPKVPASAVGPGFVVDGAAALAAREPDAPGAGAVELGVTHGCGAGWTCVHGWASIGSRVAPQPHGG